MTGTDWHGKLVHCCILLGVSKEETFESFSSISSFDDMVPVDDVRAILLMSPTEKKKEKGERQGVYY